MAKKIDLGELENPYVQVVWEDTPDNFTQERIRSVKQYFQKKYSTTNVNVVTKLKNVDEVSYHLYQVELKTRSKSKERSKRDIKDLLNQILETEEEDCDSCKI